MVTLVREVGIFVFLDDLRLKRGCFGIEPLVLGHSLVGKLFWDFGGSLDLEGDLKILADQLIQSLVLKNLELFGLVIVQQLQHETVVLHALLDSFGVNNWRLVLWSVAQIED